MSNDDAVNNLLMTIGRSIEFHANALQELANKLKAGLPERTDEPREAHGTEAINVQS